MKSTKIMQHNSTEYKLVQVLSISITIEKWYVTSDKLVYRLKNKVESYKDNFDILTNEFSIYIFKRLIFRFLYTLFLLFSVHCTVQKRKTQSVHIISPYFLFL